MPAYNFHCEHCDTRFEIYSSIEKYSSKQRCPHCRRTKSVYRDYATDNFIPNYIKGLWECATVGEYADKQSKKYGEEKCRLMEEEFKTKKTGGMQELPSGMSRATTPESLPRLPEKRKKRKLSQ